MAKVRVLKTCRALIALLPNLLADSECFLKLSRLSFSGKCPTNLGDDTLPQRIPISLTIQLMAAINIPATFCQITENRGSNLIASAFNLQVNWNLHMRMLFFLSHLKYWREHYLALFFFWSRESHIYINND